MLSRHNAGRGNFGVSGMLPSSDMIPITSRKLVRDFVTLMLAQCR